MIISSDRMNHWNKKHNTYQKKDWIHAPSLYAIHHVISRIPPKSRILDLGAGQGQDSIFFASLGHSVTALDFSPYALEQLELICRERGLRNISIVNHDLRDPLPFSNASFDVVYSHLGIHFLPDMETRQLFKEISRIIIQKGICCILANSVDDPEYGSGTKLEENFFELKRGDIKRYFSREYMYELIKMNFIPYVLDDRGVRTHKDASDTFVNLIANRI